MRNTLALIMTMILTWGGATVQAKTGSLMVTAEMRANARRNCERYDWARSYRDRLIKQVQPWVEMSDEELWLMLPGQGMPRSSSVNGDGSGCPKCGTDHFKGNYNNPWEIDRQNHPWQLRCTNCKEWFPKNDFAAYYESSLDEQRQFHLDQGDPRFLVAKEPGEFEQVVDDGKGYIQDGSKFFFTACYAFKLWSELVGASSQGSVLERLAILYTLTEDPQYAHKAGVLLARVADLYPEMDYLPHYRLGMEASTGGSGKGRVQGCIWETWTAQNVSRAYDYIYDALMEDRELLAFSQQMAEKYHLEDKPTLSALARHIEDHALLEFIEGIKDGRVRGNAGMHQEAMAATAIALDRDELTEQALDWLFQPNDNKPPFGGEIPLILTEVLGREGLSDEAGLGYASIPAHAFHAVARLLRQYPAYQKYDLYHDFPKFRNCFTMGAAVRILDRYSPNVGDSDKCMNIGQIGNARPLPMVLDAYEVYGGHELAREVWFSNNKKLDGLQLDIYAAEPEALLQQLQQDLAGEAPTLSSFNSGGYGLAVLQAPQREAGRSFFMYYGRMAGHGHADRLMLGLVAKDVVMMPDMGYPLYTGAWPPRIGWDSHTISHNTAMVNDKGLQRQSWSGKTRLFEQAGPVRVADIDGGEVQEGVTTYRRCVVMVDVNDTDSYALDLFWLRGGHNHRLIQNGGGPAVTTDGLTLVPQAEGTFAGESVKLGQFYDGPENWSYDGSGFMYLDQVERAQSPASFTVDWPIVEPRRTMPADWEAHLRVHNLTEVDEAALANGYPPAYKGNPPVLRYLLRSRFGADLHTQFVTIHEPYDHQPFIASVRLLDSSETSEGFRAAVEVNLTDGRRDVLLVTENGGTASADGVSLTGRVGWVRFEQGQPVAQSLIAGTTLTAGPAQLTLPVGQITGQLTGWDDTDPANIILKTDAETDNRELAGRYVIFDNSERTDASYRIVSLPGGGQLGIGSSSLVERFVDRFDYSQGLIYNLAPGDNFIIPLTATWIKK
jgi:hypothetical protein